jgi:hypothetical protein
MIAVIVVSVSRENLKTSTLAFEAALAFDDAATRAVAPFPDVIGK